MDGTITLSVAKQRFLRCASSLLKTYFQPDDLPNLLYLVSPNHQSGIQKERILGRNMSVANMLRNHLLWGMPTFHPTVKYHKTPLKLRPIISKRGTPSIAIGSVIKDALKLIMGNYPGYDPSLNVCHMEDLMEDILRVHEVNSAKVFFSLDVERMFDNIPMEGPMVIVSDHLNLEFSEERVNGVDSFGRVNRRVLLSLIQMDTALFDFFKYVSPRLSKRSEVSYYRQRKGIPMGGNTSSIYADLYMGFYLAQMDAELKGLGVTLNRKYVDDLLFYGPLENIPAVISLLRKYTKLDYTLDLPEGGVLAYLDLQILDIGDSVSIKW